MSIDTKDMQRGMIPSLHSLILALVLFSAGIGIAAAADPIVSISPSQSTVCVGDFFDVYIQVEPEGNTIQTTQVDLTFDSSLASLSVADGRMFGMFDDGTQNRDTVVDITGVDAGVSATGNLAVLHMQATSVGTFTLDLSGVTVATESASLTPSVNGGTVTIDDEPNPNAYDLNGDGFVNFGDVLVLIANWGPCPEA